jgi:hypothetical protein
MVYVWLLMAAAAALSLVACGATMMRRELGHFQTKPLSSTALCRWITPPSRLHRNLNPTGAIPVPLLSAHAAPPAEKLSRPKLLMQETCPTTPSIR